MAGFNIVNPPSDDGSSQRLLASAIIGVYFTGGIATAMVDTLVPKFKTLFDLSYTEAMLTQFCFFIAYFIVSVPAGWLATRIGVVRGTVTGILGMASGCLLFAPGAWLGSYSAFLFALFVIAAGTSLFQVCGNPLIASLGKAQDAHSRLTLGLAFNSLGYALGPLIGATLILAATSLTAGSVDRTDPIALHTFQIAEGHIVARPFLILALILATIAATFWMLSRRLPGSAAVNSATQGRGWSLLRRPNVVFGIVTMFLYVGAEVSIGSVLINYLGLSKTMGLGEVAAGRLMAFYWLGTMAGRFTGAILLRFIRPGLVLAVHAIVAVLLITCSLFATGWLSGGALIAVGLCNSVMFPLIFTLSIEGLGDDTPRGSALACMAISGGAVVPMLCGKVADVFGLGWTPVLPALCYICIAIYGLRKALATVDTGHAVAADAPPAGLPVLGAL